MVVLFKKNLLYNFLYDRNKFYYSHDAFCREQRRFSGRLDIEDRRSDVRREYEDPVIGHIYNGRVNSIQKFGAFVQVFSAV